MESDVLCDGSSETIRIYVCMHPSKIKTIEAIPATTFDILQLLFFVFLHELIIT